ncbi:MAG: hypothetical protein NZT92_00040 [Abditibacteriales bacterium]|nr:hypothetical protein [Abditibacteriales bacterium]MDW8364899.1 hypothetical protein [Abditibacteriales bacterium]
MRQSIIPQGRGRSEGEEDQGGRVHQEDLRAVIEFTKKLHEVSSPRRVVWRGILSWV